MDKNFHVVILAGGSGTRFWPLSRLQDPKQFLTIIGKQSLLVETVTRILPVCSPSNIWLVTGTRYRKKVQQQLKGFQIPSEHILCEPEGKNTAPAIAWVASLIHQQNPDAIMAVLPSDHVITHPKEFREILNQAKTLANENYLVTLGIVPTRPETGYGYLKVKKTRKNGQEIVGVEKFTEKPSYKKAVQFLKTKKYLWNSGMFVWKTASIKKAIAEHLPAVYLLFENQCTRSLIERVWKNLPSISIDYGILEKSNNVVTIPAQNIGWSDLGSFEALATLLPKDKNKNTLKADTISIDCRDLVVLGDKRLIATVGLENITIVDTPDALLVCRTDLSQKVKDIVDILKSAQRPEVIDHVSRSP